MQFINKCKIKILKLKLKIRIQYNNNESIEEPNNQALNLIDPFGQKDKQGINEWIQLEGSK